ncbi:serine--tRNA ligase [Candidatus Endowatersipora endosymbiont of Watersipora subatra]|uniref:serine--tRNA ligase n=1 Tax=Candidatus Endowatersipora endosymbiont of Watersipora subatra TaxID=3077946 RepID=UPI00312C9FCF
MFDIKWIRENPEEFDRGLAKRRKKPMAKYLLGLDEDRRSHILVLQKAQEARNKASKKIGAAKADGDEVEAEVAIKEIANLKRFLQSAEEELKIRTESLNRALASIDNLPASDVPVGKNKENNILYHKHGSQSQFGFQAREHYDLGESLGMMDFDVASRLSGSRFVILHGGLARLERALGQFMLDIHTEKHGYTEIQPPVLVKGEALYCTGQLPKFSEDLFGTTDGKWLIPTAEVPLTNLVKDQILTQKSLPLRYTALTHCFRSEAGSAGYDTRGMLRQHQFSKVELVSITEAERSDDEHEYILSCAEEVLKRLDLHYRVMVLCSGDMGFSARKTYDIEVWLPGQGVYREISSCSNCGDFQARRMNARYRDREFDSQKIRFVHTLNGSGIAVGRALIAIIENYQNEDGSITIPHALSSYMGGISKIEKVL